ncbi:MAG: hypothetical protein A2W00_15585 [Candidatus Eisenbacteria bacterium RBG_16_71_46]|nr:MAG: hypothetical protein A2W00_15585 [Candidatus Eisenbacteria bacterium RBG_16_71_46]
MKSEWLSQRILLATAVLAAFAGAGCTKKIKDILVPNLKPTVRLTSAPVDTQSPVFYAYRMSWVGDDPDGRVRNFVVAVDPPTDGRPIQWVPTAKNDSILFFRSTRPDSTTRNANAIDFHVFAVRAVDDRGDSSEVATRAFFSYTVAPTTQITSPRPNSLTRAFVTPAVRISWTGTDADGQFTQKPVQYRYLLIGPAYNTKGVTFDQAIQYPDSLLKFAPDFSPADGWIATSPETTQVQFTNLTPNQQYLFVVMGFDEAGAYTPIFSLNSNMLRFQVGLAGSLGPTIRMFNEFFDYTYASGGYSTDPAREIFVEVPAGEEVCFNWEAVAPPGADIIAYRWALDIADVGDNKERSDELTDLSHWSSPSLLTTRACLKPEYIPETKEHRFYVEAIDNNGLRSLGIVRFPVVRATFERPLAVVNDTRLLTDQRISGNCVELPKGIWPTTAELDTFLFAIGNVPWRCVSAGAISPAGLFAPYVFDTIGTQIGQTDIAVRLAVLGRYQHVVWITDAQGAINSKPGNDPTNPISALRYMSGPGRVNTLAAYVKQGGLVWLAGGGGAYASLVPWNRPTNDIGGVTWSNTLGELVPGRMMYDLAHWRSEIKAQRGAIQIRTSPNAVGGWPGAPNYALLPAQMRNKSAALGDVFPTPGRSGQSSGVFYQSVFDVEYLSLENRILEDLNPDPDRETLGATLDTLYKATGLIMPREVFDSSGRLVGQNPCMTIYHGQDNVPFVFTGFSLWIFSRQDCQKLVDFVLGNYWNIPRRAAPGPARAASAIGKPPAWTPPAPAAAPARTPASPIPLTRNPRE